MRKYLALTIFLLVMFSLAIYSNALFNSFAWVDHVQIVQKKHIVENWNGILNIFLQGKEGFSSTEGGYYRPVINLSFSLDYWLWRLNPFGFHLTNVIVHTVNGILLYLILSLILKQRRIALLASALFLAHPIHTESVSWISGRDDVFCALFYLLAFLVYVKAHPPQSEPSKPGRPVFLTAMLYMLSGILFIFALQSKEMAVTLPFILILYDSIFSQRHKRSFVFRKAGVYLFYFFILGGYIFFRQVVLGGIGVGESRPGESILATFYTTSRIFSGYIGQLSLPINLAVSDVVRIETGIFNISVIGSLILIIALLIIGILSYRRYSTLSFGIFWFFITLIPVSNVVPPMHMRAERFLYLPSIGFCIIVSILLAGCLKLVHSQRHQWAKTAVVMLWVIPMGYGLLTFDRNFAWKDDYTIFSDAVKKSPYAREARMGLGIAYRDKKMYREAEEQFLIALEEKEGYRSYSKPEVIHINLGYIYTKIGEPGKAVEHYLEVSRKYSNMYEAHYRLGMIYLAHGKVEWSKVKFKQALLSNSSSPRAKEDINRAMEATETTPLQAGVGDISSYTAYIDTPAVHFDLGIAYLGQKEYKAAITEFNEALSLDSEFHDARYGLAIIYKDLGDPKSSVRELSLILTDDPDSIKAYNMLGLIYFGDLRQPEKALQYFEESLRREPNQLDVAAIRQRIYRILSTTEQHNDK